MQLKPLPPLLVMADQASMAGSLLGMHIGKYSRLPWMQRKLKLLMMI